MNLKTKSVIAGLSLAQLMNACATVAPPQLVQARDAYATASNGPAGTLTPADLYEARKSLDQANAEFESHGDTPSLQDYAYVATRKIELADVKARTEIDRRKIAEATQQGVVVRDNQARNAQAALVQSREQLKDERNANTLATTELRATNDAQGQALQKSESERIDERDANKVATNELKDANAAQGKELAKTNTQLEAETQARLVAETKLAGAMKDLAAIAAVKEEKRGMVITLSGSVLFGSGKFELLDSARTKLDQVAEALKAQSPDKTMVVEGHTDSRGSDATNQSLSMNRASAVRDYLVTRGVDANKISAVGMGSSHPLMSNNTAENRANNRRVEIVIQTTKVSAL